VSTLEALGPQTWQEFLTAPRAVLVLGKTGCENCERWSAELTEWLARDQTWSTVRFGKILLDTPGLVAFKRANPWVAALEMLPHTLIYKDGEIAKQFAGGGVDRLEARLQRVFGDTA
jgi:hypothetical protein